jgi:hypothetical protein
MAFSCSATRIRTSDLEVTFMDYLITLLRLRLRNGKPYLKKFTCHSIAPLGATGGVVGAKWCTHLVSAPAFAESFGKASLPYFF